MKPETVISWHRQGFRLFWRRRSKSGQVGRPRIPRTHIAFIRRISSDHPEWGEDRIAEEFDAKFGFPHSASTIRRYMVRRTDGPRKTQTWHTFMQNHAKEVRAGDFLIPHTAFFAVVYVFVIVVSRGTLPGEMVGRAVSLGTLPGEMFGSAVRRFAHPCPPFGFTFCVGEQVDQENAVPLLKVWLG